MKMRINLLVRTVIGLTPIVIQGVAQLAYTPYTFTTVAGQYGNWGGADGIGVAAQFNQPYGLAVDSAGNLYVADSGNNTIRKVTPAGVVTTVAGLAGKSGSVDGPGNTARFHQPDGVAVDSAGNIFVADSINHTIRKVTAEGVVTTLAGLAGSIGSVDGPGNTARFNRPFRVAIDSAGTLYVADLANHTIRKVTAEGVVTTLAGLAGSIGSVDGTRSDARFKYPSGVAVDGEGNVYVADTDNQTIRKVTADGVVTTLAGLAGHPGTADGPGNTARFNEPTDVAVDSVGNVYVADGANNTIRKVRPTGEVTTLGGISPAAGHSDGTGINASFSSPDGVAVDNAGTVYVADTGNDMIRKGYPPLMLLGSRFNGGQFGLNLTAPTEREVVVDASTDLLNWLPVWTNTFVGDVLFTDPESSLPSNRFYRAYTR